MYGKTGCSCRKSNFKGPSTANFMEIEGISSEVLPVFPRFARNDRKFSDQSTDLLQLDCLFKEQGPQFNQRTAKINLLMNTEYLSSVDKGRFFSSSGSFFPPLNFLQGFMETEAKVKKFHFRSPCFCL